MARRFQILLADAFFLAAIGILAFTVTQFFQRTDQLDAGAQPVASAMLAAQPAAPAGDVVPGLGESVVSAWVRVEPGEQLILPGDEVLISVPSRASEPLGPFRVANINGAGTSEEAQAFMSLTGDRDQIKRVRYARETELLRARAHRARLPGETLDQPLLRNDQIITRRFRDRPWSRRVAAD
ncbi:MAG: hypothetical protein HRU11_09260 [Parvularculaceae bacterium]|nr:hypothetical protein [Parvularculaceae bacterium]